MKITKIIALLFVVAVMVAAQNQPTVSVRELPPEGIPAGSCTDSTSGYLGIKKDGKTKETKFTDKEIGEYVNKRLSQGYSILIYPQLSGKVFAIANCESTKKSIVP